MTAANHISHSTRWLEALVDPIKAALHRPNPHHVPRDRDGMTCST